MRNTLNTDRLILSPHTLDDYPDVARLWVDSEVVRYITGVPSTREESWARTLRYIGHWQALGYGYWTIKLRSNGQYIGEAGFANYLRTIEPPLGDTPEAGWMLVPWAQGIGHAREATAAMHQRADENLSCAQTACILDPEHSASKHLALSLGYRTTCETTYAGARTIIMHRSKSA